MGGDNLTVLPPGLPNITGVITTNDAAKINVSGAFAVGGDGPSRWPQYSVSQLRGQPGYPRPIGQKGK